MSHDQRETIDAAAITAWQAADNVRLIIPITDPDLAPFAPRCCVRFTQVELVIEDLLATPGRISVDSERRSRPTIASPP